MDKSYKYQNQHLCCVLDKNYSNIFIYIFIGYCCLVVTPVLICIH